MRFGSDHIWDVWTNGGLTGNDDYVGEAAPSTRLTVERANTLRLAADLEGRKLQAVVEEIIDAFYNPDGTRKR